MDFGLLDAHSLRVASEEHRDERLQLRLLAGARGGQPSSELDSVPVYAHVKEVVDPYGRREALEINYMNFHAYNGSYKVLDAVLSEHIPLCCTAMCTQIWAKQAV